MPLSPVTSHDCLHIPVAQYYMDDNSMRLIDSETDEQFSLAMVEQTSIQ